MCGSEQRNVIVNQKRKSVVIEIVLHSDRLVTAAPSPKIDLKTVDGDGETVMVVSVVIRDDVVALDDSDLSTTSFMVSEFWRRFCASTCLMSRVS